MKLLVTHAAAGSIIGKVSRSRSCRLTHDKM